LSVFKIYQLIVFLFQAEGFKKCQKSNPNFNDCLAGALEGALIILKDGEFLKKKK
jgi:hypothetical protein